MRFRFSRANDQLYLKFEHLLLEVNRKLFHIFEI